MSLYPDNVNRANRVQRLASDIIHDQTRLKEDVENARAEDERSIKVLNEIATNAGYKTLDEYIADAESKLTPEEKAAIDKMKTDMEKLDEDMAISHKVFRGLIALGLLTKGVRIFATALQETQSILFGLQAVVRAIWHAILGSVETAAKLLTFGRVVLNLTGKTAGITANATRGMKLMKIGGNVLVGVGVIVDAALLIAEAIQGAQQRADLQKDIKELCAKRFVVRQIQQTGRVILNFKSDAKSIINMKKKYDEWVAKGRMTIEEVAEEMQPEMDKASNDMKAQINKNTTDVIWKSLKDQDNLGGTWTEEDADLPWVEKWIEEHPTEEKKG
ncbi:hypothetical protein FRC12_021205 [Ceratobasidium sp. 428]|nr:hypothetical protein FRC12_021205 [Ceratobasidium sp. 428]